MSDALTHWQAGRLDAGKGPKSVLFGRTYEDPRVERKAFGTGGRVLCIASAGCTPRALAAHHDQVVAVDINPVQLEYARLRLAGAPAQIGRAERVMAAARRLLPLTGIRRTALQEFLAMSDGPQQRLRWRRLCTRRFRLGLRLLMSFTGLRAVYASPLLRILPARFDRVLLGRFERAFSRHSNVHNPYARALFLGEPAPDEQALERPVELVCADAAAYLESQRPGSFRGISLSNILDGASTAYQHRLLTAVRRALSDEGSMVLRSFAEPSQPEDEVHAAFDRAMLWGSVRVCGREELARLDAEAKQGPAALPAPMASAGA